MFISSGQDCTSWKVSRTQTASCSTRVLNRSPPAWPAAFRCRNALVQPDSLRNVDNVNLGKDSPPIVTVQCLSCCIVCLSVDFTTKAMGSSISLL